MAEMYKTIALIVFFIFMVIAECLMILEILEVVRYGEPIMDALIDFLFKVSLVAGILLGILFLVFVVTVFIKFLSLILIRIGVTL